MHPEWIEVLRTTNSRPFLACAVLLLLLSMTLQAEEQQVMPAKGISSGRGRLNPPLTEQQSSALEQIEAYSRDHGGVSLFVMKDGFVIYEDSERADQAHNLYSGTKSFACPIAVAAADDGLLDLDEPVSNTIHEWRETQLEDITIRQLLTLTGGVDAGVNGTVPSYRAAVKTRRTHPSGVFFQYGPIPFQVFGELMRRKLAPENENILAYLKRRVLNPAGVTVQDWKVDPDGNPRLPGGAFLSAREWARFGQLLLNHGRGQGQQILDPDLLTECFHGTQANPGYGISFWLPARGGLNVQGRRARPLRFPEVDTILMALGVGGQRLYIIPSRHLVIVRQARDGHGDFEDALFLSPLLDPDLPGKDESPTSIKP